MPGETNALNNLFGGELLARMDRAASISAKRHSEEIVVTSSVNHVSFGKAIPIGTTVTIEAKVSRAFTTSMEVFIDVWIDDDEGKKIKANEAIYTFVAVDKNGRPTKIDKILYLLFSLYFYRIFNFYSLFRSPKHSLILFIFFVPHISILLL